MKDPELFAGYTNGPGVLRKTLLGMTHDQLKARPIEGKWSTHEVAIHVADADAAFTHRLKRILAEDRPAFDAWSENDYIAKLAYDAQSAEDAVSLIEINHRQMLKIFAAQPDGWLDRKGVHPERGEQSARDVLKFAVWHLSHHLKFVEEKKAKLGL